MTAATVILGLFAITRLWFVDGLIRGVTIEGPSMAPAFCGANYVVMCADCGLSFRCDADHLPNDGKAACPNCGFAENRLEAARLAPPDRVLIDRWSFLWGGLHRGDVVAFRASAGDLAVKRVAALPRERLAIKDGDLYDGQQLVRKTRAGLHAVRLLVHDNDFQPQRTPGLPPRWHASASGSRWKAQKAGFRIEPTDEKSESFDWLEYDHWPSTADPRLRGIASPISDNDPYNQAEIHRPLNAVTDVMLSCRLRVEGTGRFVFAAVDGNERFEVEIEPRKHVTLRSAGHILLDQPLKMNLSRRGIDIDFGLCDQQVLLAVGGRTVVRYEYKRRAGTPLEVLHPLAIGARGIGLQLDHLRVWRDVYYLDPQGLPRSWDSGAPLAADEFAVLGDNQPVSLDSRHWASPGIPRSALLGRVYQPFWLSN